MKTEPAPLVLTDRNQLDRWDDLVRAAEAPNSDGLEAALDPVDDDDYDEATPADLATAFPDAAVIFAADAEALADDDFPILCIDPEGLVEPFRVLAADIWMVENSLASGDLTLEDLAEEVGPDGILVDPDRED
ncbi:DUF6924 domain-containing protein [Pelagovum pacificum]|uniref:DUF6924 domain-containing protein n=1 Tax=Pelagovum pacificum TaxID=2588711 RepID=A0A5C5GDA5_9RHOB|nr:hypothetical protein [Pelagovum pacificum]QQA41223.1 hypothetical protein I8N54_10305 [Pelagovum pacificum]TNY31969.1 hypothetical protein FHY64_01295 [Pelagovum pacificum]